MKTALIISEYNPFHKGHRHQIDVLKTKMGVSHIISIMSGNFVQRGAPAIFDKFERARLAVLGGCDLVLELPTVYSVSSAEFFAKGGIYSANEIGIADILSFGSEFGEIDKLKTIANILITEAEDIDKEIGIQLKIGLSFPEARQNALLKIIQNNNSDKINEEDLDKIFQPNNILAIEYLKALQITDSKITPHTLQRKGLGYHETYEPDSSVEDINPSATSIRKLMDERKDSSTLIPPETLKSFKKLEDYYHRPDQTILKDIVHFKLRLEPDSLLLLPDSGDGLGERILNNSHELRNMKTLDQFVTKIKTRRFTYTRIMRLLLQFALNLNNVDYQKMRNEKPDYLRVLGFNEKGVELLSKANSVSNIPLVHSLKNIDSPFIKPDINASELYALLTPSYPYSSDFTRKTEIIR
ncbi:MAG: nucleotidyltransferase family protein [Clostridiaceae bacterium]